MLQKIFIFGVIVPTVITVAVFVAFLVCWFKFDLRGKLFPKKNAEWLEKSTGFQKQTDENVDLSVSFDEKPNKDNGSGSKKDKKNGKGQGAFIFRISHGVQQYQPMEDNVSIADDEAFPVDANINSPLVAEADRCPEGPNKEDVLPGDTDMDGNEPSTFPQEDGTEGNANESSLVIQTYQFHEHDLETFQCVGPDVETDCDDGAYSELVPASKVHNEQLKHKQFKSWREKMHPMTSVDINETDSETSKLVVAT